MLKDVKFSGGDQSVSVHGGLRHASFVRRAVDDGRTHDSLQSLLRTPAGVLQSTQRPAEDSVLGPRWMGDLVQAAGNGNFPVSLCRDWTQGDRGLGVGSAAGRDRPESGTAKETLQPANGASGKPG